MPLAFYLNEQVTVVEKDKNTGKLFIEFEDGFSEWVPEEEVEIYQGMGISSHGNTRKKQEKFEKSFGSKGRAQKVQLMPCVICGAIPSENAHVRSRGAGGGKADIVPLCSNHHREQGSIGITSFEEKYDVNLKIEAERINVILKKEGL